MAKKSIPYRVVPYRVLVSSVLLALSSGAMSGHARAADQTTAASRHSLFDHTHSVWNDILKQNVQVVDGGQASLFNYEALGKNRAALKPYLDSLSGVSEATFKSFTRDQQLAFLINAYNAFIVDLILENYPLSSIKRLGIPFVGPWKKSYIPLLGKKMSPDDLEHGLIRKEYKEPRIHFGVNCASISCPPLRAEAFVGDRLSQQLDEQASLFFSNPKENRFDGQKKVLTLNPILDWFDEDFTSTGSEGHVLYAAKYMKELQGALQSGVKPGEIVVKFGDYNWDLNDTAPKK